jgi:hypothetical protein
MQKRTFLLFVLLLSVFTQISAQVSVAPKVGLNLAQFVGEHNDMDPQRITLPQFGCLVNIDLHKNFALQPSIIYSKKGEKMKSYEGTPGKYYFSYLEMPVNAVYAIPIGQTKLQLFAGPYLGYCLKATLEVIEDVHYFDFDIGNSENDVFKAFDFGYNAGIGFRFGKIQTQASYSKSLTTISNYGELKNSVFTLSFAYLFALKKKGKDTK